MDASDKKQDRIISKTEIGNKKMDEMLKRLEVLERSARNPSQVAGNQTSFPPYVKPTLWNPHTGDFIPATGNTNGLNGVAESGSSNQNQNDFRRNNEPVHPPPQTRNTMIQNNHAQAIESRGDVMENRPFEVPTYAEITRSGVRGEQNTTENQHETRNWRQRLHLLDGAAGGIGAGTSFAADIDIVAFNVNKNISAMDMRSWLSQRGINVKDCKLMTTAEDARSLSFKITIDPKDYQKATTDASVWPYQVGVRRFKRFNQSRLDTDRKRKDERDRYGEPNSGFQRERYNSGYQGHQEHRDNQQRGTGQNSAHRGNERFEQDYSGDNSRRSFRQSMYHQ